MERMWYYIHENNQKGPVAQAELARLLQEGFIQNDTYVWTEGMADWKPISAMDFSGQIPQTVPQKPTSITVFGVLNIVFGSLGVLCSPIGIVGILMPQTQPGVPSYSMPMKAFLLFSSGLGLLTAGVLLAAGIGLLYQKRWARQTSYYYGWFAIIWGGFASLVTVIGMMSSMPEASGPAAAGIIGGVVGGVCGGLMGLIYPIFLVVYMRKPNIVTACSR